MIEMANENGHAVTVVRAVDSNGRPNKTATFKDVVSVQVSDGHLSLADFNHVMAIFPPGQWISYHREDALVSYGRKGAGDA